MDAIRLRLLSIHDRGFYRALYTSPEVMRTVGPVPDDDELDARFGRVLRHNRAAVPGHRAWCIRRGDDARGVGLAALHRAGDRAQLGIMLLPHAWRRGVARRSIAVLATHAFDVMRLAYLDVARPDDAQARVLDALLSPFGFVRTTRPPGEAGWTLSRDAFRATRAACRS